MSDKRLDLLNALEFGYVQCEKGHNIEKAISEFDKIYFNKESK